MSFFHVQRIQQRLLWWEELTGLLQSQPALLTQEASLRLGSVVTMMEQLTSDDALTFGDMETILSDVRTALNEGLHACVEGEADRRNGFSESWIESVEQTAHFCTLRSCAVLIATFQSAEERPKSC